MPLEIILIVACVALSACFSGSETALTALSPTALEHLITQERRQGLLLWREHPIRILITILIGNNAVNMTAASLATVMAERAFRNWGVAVVVGGMTLVLILFGEIFPKSIAKQRNVSLAPAAILYLRFFYILLYPLVIPIHALVKLVAFGPVEGFEERDLIFAIHLSKRKGILPGDRARMLLSIVHLENLRVREIMVPRTKVVYRDIALSREELIRAFREQGYSRIPIYRDKEDNIVGVLHAKDLLGTDRPVDVLLKPAFFIPESRRVPHLLRDMQKRHQHMAIVVDEFGSFVGAVTLEDVLEEIVGEIQDEFDLEGPEYKKLSDSSYVFAGDTPLNVVNRTLETALELSSDYETLGGFLTARLGRMGVRGDRIPVEGWSFEIQDADPRRVISVKATAAPAPDGRPR
jgi:CBS domain containing-hemolysin-like protein